jgi:hypothetical protein
MKLLYKFKLMDFLISCLNQVMTFDKKLQDIKLIYHGPWFWHDSASLTKLKVIFDKIL